MKNDNDDFEKIPDFLIQRTKKSPVNENFVQEEKQPSYTKLTGFEKDEISKIRENLSKQSTLRVNQNQALVDFDSYKGETDELIKYLSSIFQSISEWNEETLFNVLKKFVESDIQTTLNKIAFLPRHDLIGNLIELLASAVETGIFEIGSIIETEMTFQRFKKIYSPKVQILLLPFLFYIYDLDKKLLPAKKVAFQVLNKHGRTFEATFIMDDIQKSTVRIKKAQELLIQEKYNLDQKIKENIDLLLLLSGKESFFYPIYKIYKDSVGKTDINLEKLFAEAYKVDSVPPKPLTQQLLMYKTGPYGEKIINKIIRWAGRNSGEEFRKFFINCFKEVLSGVEIGTKNFPSILRDIIFSTMEIAKKKSWNVSDTIEQMLQAIINSLDISDVNMLRIVSYNIAAEVIAGVIKVKYKIDEAVQGLAKGVVLLKTGDTNGKIFDKPHFYKTVCEFVYCGMWDITIEIYPNLLTVEKNADLFVKVMDSESKRQQTDRKENQLKTMFSDRDAFNASVR